MFPASLLESILKEYKDLGGERYDEKALARFIVSESFRRMQSLPSGPANQQLLLASTDVIGRTLMDNQDSTLTISADGNTIYIEHKKYLVGSGPTFHKLADAIIKAARYEIR